MKKIKIIFLLSLFIFSILSTTSFAQDYMFKGETLHATSSIDDDYYGVDTVTNILDDLSITYNDNTKVSYTYYVNQAYKYLKQNVDNTIGVINICFYKSQYDNLTMMASNGSFSNTLKFLALTSEPTTKSYIETYFFSDWQKNTDGIITGINTIQPKVCSIKSTEYEFLTENKGNSNVKAGTNEIIGASQVKWEYILAPTKTYTYAGYTQEMGYSWYFIGNTIRFSKEASSPGGGNTSGETSGDAGGGTGGSSSVDLTMTNEKIDELNNKAEEIKDKIPTSGDITTATTQGNKDYWGNTEEMKGEDYENEINNGINNSMDKISEELEKNKIFNSIAIAEQKIIDLFLEKPEDFKISWQAVKYMGKELIPAGEVNFSQMCRDNETLGKVKNTLNIIVSAMISLSLFKYIFNLIMVTLGIDHPLILEEEKDDITEITSTKIGNKKYITRKTYKSDKKGG